MSWVGVGVGPAGSGVGLGGGVSVTYKMMRTLPCAPGVVEPPVLPTTAWGDAGGCTVTPGGSAPRMPSVPVARGSSAPGNGVKVGRGVLVGVGTMACDRPTSTSPSEQARLVMTSTASTANSGRIDLRAFVWFMDGL